MLFKNGAIARPTLNRPLESGQTFVEFLLLLLVLVGLSIALIKGFNGGLADRWQALVQVIAAPSNDPIELN